MIKSISFIVLTKFFHFNELTFLRQPGYLIFKVYFCNIIVIVTQLGWFTELVISCNKTSF